MSEALLSPLATWQNFYVIIGTAAATLTGLTFVVVTLIAGVRERASSPSEAFATFNTPSVVHFSLALLVAAILSAPWQALWQAGVLLGLSGLGGVSYVLIVLRRVRRQRDYQPVLEDWLFHTVLPLVAYTALVVAGVVVGPVTPGFVADQHMANELAEIGIILLMFGVGLHFSLEDLLAVRAIAVPGALGRMAFAVLLGTGLGRLLGWTVGASFLFGLALSVASTVVALRALQERRLLDSERGRIAIAWLIVEDLAMVLALVLAPAIARLLDVSFEEGGAVATAPMRVAPVLGTVSFTLLR